MRKVVFWVMALLIFGGCASKHDVILVGFNSEEILKSVFDETTETVTVIMPDGEVLNGKYNSLDNEEAVYFSNAFGYSSGSRYYRGGSFGSVGIGLNFGYKSTKYALLTSQTSPLKMEILITIKSWSKNGFGEAKTNNGKIYKIQF
jgi:small nuclear ribonucleoprotein (snRNP)-like protein